MITARLLGFQAQPVKIFAKYKSASKWEEAGMRARLYSADAGAPLTVYFHGGGFVIGDLDTHDAPCRILCRHSGSHVLSVAYRLAPQLAPSGDGYGLVSCRTWWAGSKVWR